MQKIGIGLLVLLGLGVVAGLVMPTTYAIEREVTIDATPAQVHEFVGHLEKWPEWAPWQKHDETLETVLGDKTTGIGASQSWSGKDGEGELTLTQCDASTGIAYDMAFINGDVRAPSTCAMNYTQEGSKTKVSWTMEGDFSDMMPPVLSGLMAPLTKSMIGGFFDEGLQDLKVKVETSK